MQKETTLIDRAVSGALPTAAALLLFCCAQAGAATSEVLCDRLASRVVSLELPEIEFSIDVAEHGIDSRVDVPDTGLALKTEYSLLPPLAPNRIDLAPLASAILKEVFEESAARQFRLDEDSNPVRTVAGGDAPLPEQPAADAGDTEGADSDALEDDTAASDTETRLPGISDEQALRYRKQMFRTDI